MLKLGSIAGRFRFSYLLFAALLCTTYAGIFWYANAKIEPDLIEAKLLQQLEQSLHDQGDQPSYRVEPGIDIYKSEAAPEFYRRRATDQLQQIERDSKEIYFFKHYRLKQEYLMVFDESSQIELNAYPALSVFEFYEDAFANTLLIATALNLIVAVLFSYLSSRQITRPLVSLKKAVEQDNKSLHSLPGLPSEVEVLAQAIDEKNRQLTQYLQREQLFTGDVSHEMRTPLTIILGAAEVLESQLDQGLTDKKRLGEFVQRIQTTAKEASETISALLLLSRAPEKLDATLVDICPVVHRELERLNYLIKSKPVRSTLTAEQNHQVLVRPELLKMVVGNLIKNAFQYTETGTVTVYVDATRIRVVDTGFGISKQIQQNLFTRFERGEHAQIEGTGLGLSIVKRITDHLGWQLSYQPNSGQGSVFTVTYAHDTF